jgi:anti-sigma B factor antagonist
MDIKTSEKDGIVIVEVGGEINISSSPDLKKSFEKIQAMKVVINMARVGYVDSSGLATLVELLKRLKMKGGALYLTQMSDKVRSLFEITKLDKLFGIYPNDEAALKSAK